MYQRQPHNALKYSVLRVDNTHRTSNTFVVDVIISSILDGFCVDCWLQFIINGFGCMSMAPSGHNKLQITCGRRQ